MAATTVAISRYMVVAGATEHFTITGDTWNWFNTVCGAAMAVLEGVSVWYCWRSWSQAKPCAERNVLLTLIVATVVSLYGSIMPTIVAGASGAEFVNVVPGVWMFAWATCVTVAPFAIMSANAIAGTLRDTQQGVQEHKPHTVTVEAMDGTLHDVPQAVVERSAKPPEIVFGYPAVRVDDIAQAVREANPPTQSAPQPAARPTLLDLLSGNPNATRNDLAAALGISPQAVSAQKARLVAEGKIRVNGHVEVV